MAYIQLSAEDKKEAVERAQLWQRFREENKLSQRFLGDIIGISRRTIQSIEAALVKPHESTLKAFAELQEKYRKEGKSDGSRKHKAA